MAAGVIIVADAGGSVLKVGRMDEAGPELQRERQSVRM